MWQSHKQQAAIAVVLGGACMFGAGLAGCARETGLDLAKQDARTNSAVTERANESILRSRKELATSTGKGGAVTELAEMEDENDDKPSLASRWSAPFRSAGGLLKRKSDEPASDPFLADSKDAGKAKEKDKSEVQDSIAALSKGGTTPPKGAAGPADTAQKKSTDTRIASATETKTGAARTSSAKTSESQAALDEFLKSQEPIGVADRAIAASHEADLLTRKPGTSTESKRASKEQVVSATDVETESFDFTNGTAVASAGKARPFPATATVDVDLDEPEAPAAKARMTASKNPRNPLAAPPAGVRRNPLIEDTDEAAEETAVATRSKQANGREIANLLRKAKAAGEQGEFEEAKSYALAANDLAEQCSYEFAAREASPEKVVKWIESRQARSEQAASPAPERRAIAATRRPQRELAATTTSFSKPSAEQVFSEEIEAAATTETRSVQRPQRSLAAEGSAFNRWASGVGVESSVKESSPDWPVLSRHELAASDDLWQPSRSDFEQSLSRLKENVAPSRPSETRLASAQSDAPAFVATAEGSGSRQIARTVRTSDPIVQLGEPTDLAPGVELAGAQGGVRRGPRLATPPPLSIDGEARPRIAAKSRSLKTSRTVWFAAVGGLALLTLVGFRRWAYRSSIS